MEPLYDMNTIRETGENIRVHGNGFIQIDLPENSRLHIWGHPDIPRQAESSQIHSHRFGFVSTVLVGSLVNVVYNIHPHRLHDIPDKRIRSEMFDMYVPQPRKSEDTELILVENNTPLVYGLTPSRIEHCVAGGSYTMQPREVHETFVNQPTATLMTKRNTDESHTPEIYLPHNKRPDNQFTRYTALDDEALWNLTMDVLNRGNGIKLTIPLFYQITDTRMLNRDAGRQYIFFGSHGYCIGMYSSSFRRWNLKNKKRSWWEVGDYPLSASHYYPLNAFDSKGEPDYPFGPFDALMTVAQYDRVMEIVRSLTPSKKNMLFSAA